MQIASGFSLGQNKRGGTVWGKSRTKRGVGGAILRGENRVLFDLDITSLKSIVFMVINVISMLYRLKRRVLHDPLLSGPTT